MKKKIVLSILVFLFTGICNLYATTWIFTGGSGATTFSTSLLTDWDDGFGVNPTLMTDIVDIDISVAPLILDGNYTFGNVTISSVLEVAGNCTFNSVTISAGELDVDAGKTLTINTNMTNAGVLFSNGGTVIVKGDFTVDVTASNTSVTNGTLSVAGVFDVPASTTSVVLTSTKLPASVPTSGGVPTPIFGAVIPVPIPLSPWAVVLGLGLIGTTVVLRRKKVA